MKQHDPQARYKYDNILDMQLDPADRTTQDYEGPDMHSQVNATPCSCRCQSVIRLSDFGMSRLPGVRDPVHIRTCARAHTRARTHAHHTRTHQVNATLSMSLAQEEQEIQFASAGPSNPYQAYPGVQPGADDAATEGGNKERRERRKSTSGKSSSRPKVCSVRVIRQG